jgi:TonB family protein
MIRANVLDKDWFDSAPNTPKRTSWTMELLAHLDKAFGSNVMDRPVFPVSEPEQPVPVISGVSKDVALGKYDALFQGAPNKPSDLYHSAQRAVPSPDIKVQIDTPIRPEARVQPAYPLLARMARVEGKVVLKFRVNQDGTTSNIEFESGHPMLRGAVEKAVNSWTFFEDAVGKEIEATIEFIANCPVAPAN